MNDIAKIKSGALSWNNKNAQEFYDLSKLQWDNPELLLQEFESSKVLSDKLKSYGFTVDYGIAEMPTAFTAVYGSGAPVIAINCEYDALPGMSQKSDVAKPSPVTEGAPGQACGHNLLGTAGVKAAISVRKALEEYSLPGTVMVIGAPAEEMVTGKPILGKHGVLSGADAYLDWHPWSYNRVDAETCNAAFWVKYHFKGKACHGNAPWHGKSALDGAMLFAHAIELLREHLEPGNPPDAATTVNYTIDGPKVANIIPPKTSVVCVGRFVTTDAAVEARERIENCAKGAALATGTEVEAEVISASHHKIPNEVLSKLMHDNLKELGLPTFTEEEQRLAANIQKEMGVAQTGISTTLRPFGGGSTVVTDTSEYSWNAPYATAWIAMAPENIGWHNWGVTFCAGNSMGQKGMDKAADLIAVTAIDLFCNPEILARAKEEWLERLNGETYSSLLPDDYTPPYNFYERKA